MFLVGEASSIYYRPIGFCWFKSQIHFSFCFSGYVIDDVKVIKTKTQFQIILDFFFRKIFITFYLEILM